MHGPVLPACRTVPLVLPPGLAPTTQGQLIMCHYLIEVKLVGGW